MRRDEEVSATSVVCEKQASVSQAGVTVVFAIHHPMAPFIAELIYVAYALLSQLEGIPTAESLQMASSVSELAIADARRFLDLARVGAATCRGTLGVQASVTRERSRKAR